MPCSQLHMRLQSNSTWTNCMTSLALFLMVSCTFEEGISMGFLGGRGLFCAMFVSCLSVALTHFLMEKNIKISLPDSVPPNVSAPFEALIPLVANIIVFYLLNTVCRLLTGTIIPEFIMNIFKPLLVASDSLGGMLIYAFLMNALWIVGINGGNIVNSVMGSVLLVNLAENAEAYAAGQEMTRVFCYSPNTSIINPGGSGAALALIIAALIVAKSDHLKSITKLGGPGTIFNISEPIVYGYPIVLNSFLFIPFVVAPLVNTTVFYLLMRAGLIGKMFINVPWVLPGPLQVFLATLDWKAFVVHILLIVLDVFMYLPFVKMYDNQLLKEQGIALEQEKES
ncbi:PTS sugar transporter subunit IIC [Lachnospiraceae bacterium]|nr:PTS sugar transporter subunit IIC [Lachnospiraceae bacterium]